MGIVSNNPSYHIVQMKEQQIGYPHIENKYWEMVRMGKTQSLSNAFKESLVDCYEVVVPTAGHTIVHESVILDRREVFKLCEVYGADWDQQDVNGVTSLMKACALNRIFYVNKLIELGADAGLKDNRGRTASDYANQYDNLEVLDILQDIQPL